MKKCGSCQICCKLLPVREVDKPANTRCRHQKHGKGCGVYGKPAMPLPCSLWNCRWLLEDRTEALRRPDRAGYVIDVMPDYVRMRNDLTGDFMDVAVLQIWVDPARPDDWRDDNDLFAYVERIGREEGMAALFRNGQTEAVFVAPPSVNPQGEWFMSSSTVTGPPHTARDMLNAGFQMKMVLEGDPR